MATRTFWVLILFYLSGLVLALAVLGVYEENFEGPKQLWYSLDSMSTIEVSAYVLTYILSFPFGLLFSFLLGSESKFFLETALLNAIFIGYVTSFLGKKLRPQNKPQS